MDLSEFKHQTNMKEVAKDYGFMPNRTDNICCPFHNDKTPSMKLYDDHFHCFGCGAHGDVIDFVAEITGTDKISAAEEIRDRYCLNISDKPVTDSVVKRLEKAEQDREVEYFIRVLTKFCKVKEKYLEKNNLPVNEIIDAKIDIEHADGILETLIKLDKGKRYEFVKGFRDGLVYYEKGIEDSIVKIRHTKEREAI